MAGTQEGYLNIIEQRREAIMEVRSQFRNLLEKYGLVELAGGEGDALDWLEGAVIQLADSVVRRERFLRLIRETREVLTRNQQIEERRGNLPENEGKEKPNPYVGRRYRKFNLTNEVKDYRREAPFRPSRWQVLSARWGTSQSLAPSLRS